MCNVQRAEGAPGPATCRSLFGPVDHAELSRELHVRLREMQEQSSRRWDFDFQREVPLPGGRYVWEESAAETVPRFYRSPGSPAAAPGDKRPALITEFFPVRKKMKVVSSLCDKLLPASPIPTEHTPRKMIR